VLSLSQLFFIGNLFLSWIGFKLSIVLIFGPINIGAIFWLLNFEFSIGNEFDYDWVKILIEKSLHISRKITNFALVNFVYDSL